MKTALTIVSGIGVFLGILSINDSFHTSGQTAFNALVGGIIWITWGILCLIYINRESK